MLQQHKRRIVWILAGTLLAVLVFAVTVLAVSLWQNGTITVTPYTVSHSRIPKAFDGKRIVQITDLHNKDFGDKLIDAVARQEPDLIVITGDLISRNTVDFSPAIRQVEALAAMAPTLFVTGNHEAHSSCYNELAEALKACGVTVLHDESVLWELDGESVQIIGMLSPEFGSYLPYNLPPLVDESLYTVALVHHPDWFEEAAQGGAELILSGHTHGGQIRLPLIGALYAPGQGLFPRYDVGRFETNGATMILSQGLGEEVLMRILTPPEITVITLDSPAV